MRKSESARFWEKVDFSGPCWEWQAFRLNGYGRFGVGGAAGCIVYAHRWAWENLVGPIPDGLQIDHLCRNRRCVNPDHLEPVTPKENSLRSYSFAAQNARKTRCPKGHEYTEENVYNMASGNRVCRVCMSENRKTTARQNGYVPPEERTHCSNKHPWSEENTYWSPSGRRSCRACGREAQRRYQRKKMSA